MDPSFGRNRSLLIEGNRRTHHSALETHLSLKTISRVLVCGASGYVGGRLVPKLLDQGLLVRCLVRSPEKLRAFPWCDDQRLEVIPGNLDDVQTVRAAADGVDAAYYLVHSMISAVKITPNAIASWPITSLMA